MLKAKAVAIVLRQKLRGRGQNQNFGLETTLVTKIRHKTTGHEIAFYCSMYLNTKNSTGWTTTLLTKTEIITTEYSGHTNDRNSLAYVRLCYTDGEFDRVGWMEAHAVAVGASQRPTRQVGEPLVVVRSHFVQERVVIAQKLHVDRHHVVFIMS